MENKWLFKKLREKYNKSTAKDIIENEEYKIHDDCDDLYTMGYDIFWDFVQCENLTIGFRNLIEPRLDYESIARNFENYRTYIFDEETKKAIEVFN